MSSKMSLTNSQFYLKITPCYCASPHFDPLYVCPLSSRPLYPHMIMCKNAIAACNDKNVWLQSVYIFPLFTNEKKMGYGCYAFFLPLKLTPLSLYILNTLYFKGKFRKKMNMIFFFWEIHLNLDLVNKPVRPLLFTKSRYLLNWGGVYSKIWKRELEFVY